MQIPPLAAPKRRLARDDLRVKLFSPVDQNLPMTLSHFSAALVFALFASVVFGITQRNDARSMLRYGAYCFALFVGGVVVGGWFLWLLKH